MIAAALQTKCQSPQREIPARLNTTKYMVRFLQNLKKHISGIRLGYIPAIALIYVIALFVRLPVIMNRPLIGFEMGDDATSHVLATCKSWENISSRYHCWLPTVTQDYGPSRFINNFGGASVMTRDGLNIYTSYPPGAFLFAYWYFKITHTGISVQGLRILGLLLHFASGALLVAIAVKLTKCLNAVGKPHGATLVSLVVVWIFHPETMRSFTVSYWGQQVNQVLLPLAAILLLGKGRNARIIAWIVLLLACFVEYSALCAAVAAGIYHSFIYYRFRRREDLFSSTMFLVLPVASIALILFWFSLKMPVTEYLSHLVERAGVNSSVSGTRAPLAILYWIAIVSVPLALSSIFRKSDFSWLRLAGRESKAFPRSHHAFTALALLGGACLENIVMAHHVQAYPYDTLKILFFSLLVVGISGSFITPGRSVRQLTIATALAPLFILNFWLENRPSIGKKDAVYYYQRVGALYSEENKSDTLMFSNWYVKAAEIFYAGRNIICFPEVFSVQVSRQSVDQMREECRRRNLTHGIHVAGDSENIKTLVILSKFNTIDRNVECCAVDLKTGARTPLALSP